MEVTLASKTDILSELKKNVLLVCFGCLLRSHDELATAPPKSVRRCATSHKLP